LPYTAGLSYNGAQPPHFQVDQNNCVYISSPTKQAVSFQFALDQVDNTKAPIVEDRQKIIFYKLSEKTDAILNGVKGRAPVEQDKIISSYIKTSKKYNTNLQ